MTGESTKPIEIAMAALRQGDEYLLQYRNGDPSIGAAGLIGFYGGKIEDRETPLKAICREIPEETTLILDPAAGRDVGDVKVDSDMKGRTVQIHAQVFEFVLEAGLEVESREGELVRMTEEQLRENRGRLTPATRKYFETLVPIL